MEPIEQQNENESIVVTVQSAHYNDMDKCIKFHMLLDSGHVVGGEWPITMFRFEPGMDIDEEMRKTARLMPGKKLEYVYKPK